MKVVLIAVLGTICSVWSSTIPTPAPVNYTKMVVDHLLSSKGKTKETSLVIAQQRSDSPQTPAEDRIFFPPYKFPFWGLPYGIYSNGGFFNPGLFPFVPGGPAFPPYDGIFGGPFGPGEFPGGGPTPFQGPKPNKTIPNYYGNAAGIQPFSPYPPFPLEASSKKSNRKSNRIARSADDKEEWAATEQKGPTVLVMGGGGGGAYPSSYGMYGPSYSYAGSNVYMIKPPQAPAYGAQPYGYSSPQPYAAAPAMAYTPQSVSSPQPYAAAPAMAYTPQSVSSPQPYAAAPAMAYAPQPMSYPAPYGAPAMSYGPPMMGYGMPYQPQAYGASTPYMPPGGGYQMGPPNKPDDNKSEEKEKPKKTKKKKKKKKTKKVVYKYIREPCECETDCDDCECEETETSPIPDSTTTTAPPTTTAYTTTTTPAPNNPNPQPPPRYGPPMPHPRPSYQAPQYPGPPQYSPTPQPDHQPEGYYTPTETTAMIHMAEASNQNAQYAESPYNSRQQPSRFNRNMRKRSPQRNYRPMTLPHNVPQRPRPRYAQRNPQYNQPVSVTLPKMPAPPQMPGLGIGQVPKLPRLPDIKSVPRMPSTATKGYAQQTVAGGSVQKQKAAAPTSVPELNLPELPDIPQIPMEFLGSQVPSSIYGQTEQEESPSFVVDDVQVADQYGVELLGNAVPQGFAGEDPYHHFESKFPELSSLESKTHQVELQPQREDQQPQREHQKPQQEYQQPHREYQQPQREYQQPQREYQTPQREYQSPQREYQSPQREYQLPQREYQPSQHEYQQPQREHQSPQREYQPPQHEYQQPQLEHQQPQREQQQPQQYHSAPSYQNSLPEHTEPGPGPHEQVFPVPIGHEYSQLMQHYGQDSTQTNQAHQTYQPQTGSYDPSQQYDPIQQNYQHHPSVTEYNANPNSVPSQYEVPQQQYSPPAPYLTSPQYAAVQQYGNAPQYHSLPQFTPEQQQVQQEMTTDSDHYTDNQDHDQSNTPAYYPASPPADSGVDDVGVLDTGPPPLYGAQNDLSNSHSSPSLYPRPNYSGSFSVDSQSVPPEAQQSDNQHNNYIPEYTMPSSPSPQVDVPDYAAPSDFNHYVPVGSGSLQDIFSSVDSDRRLFAKRNLPPQHSLQETSKKSESISREDQDDSSLLTTFALENDKPENRSYRIGVYSTSNGGPSTSFAMVGPKNIMVYASTSKNNTSAPAGSTTGDPFNVQKLPGIPVDGPGNLVGMISGAPKSGSAALGFVEPVDQGEDYIDVDTKPSSRAGR